MLQSVLDRIVAGEYTQAIGPLEYNGFGDAMPRAKIYDVGDGITFHTYNDKHYFIYIDGELVKSTRLDQTQLIDAFAQSRERKKQRVMGA